MPIYSAPIMTFTNRIWDVLNRNRFFFIPYLIFLIVGSILLLAAGKETIFLFVNKYNAGWADFFFFYFTNLGDGLFCTIVVILLLFIRYKYAIIAALSFVVTSLMAQGLKHFVFADALRPFKYFEGSSQHIHYLNDLQLNGLHSFPSGHATTAFSTFCLLSLIAVQKRIGLLFFLLALLAAYSRVYLAQHFFGDIFFGSLLGTLPTVLIYILMMHYFQSLNSEWPQKSLMKR
ncbi:MAG: phosphatase PAP2 family protein [Flavisolibacter sp.]|nr:phosphatase PAP2 family protein [Flavisolibacter sp.]